MSAEFVSNWFIRWDRDKSLSLQGVASHVLDQASFVHVVLLFPAASLMIHRVCSENGCRDRRRFRKGAVVVTIVCSVCWSSASARRASATHCLFRRMYGGVTPVTTGSMTVGVDRMHPRTPGGGCCLVLRQVSVCGHCDTTLENSTRPKQKQVRLLIFEECQCAPHFVPASRRSKLPRALTFFESWDRCFE